MTEAEGVVTRLARAKVNLCLHVVGRRADGYHLLESLVVFPEMGDEIAAEPAAGLSLSIDGPFGMELAADADNLVLRAAEALRAELSGSGAGSGAGAGSGVSLGAALKLRKSLPVASGVGGGSADAAAALRALCALWGRQPSEAALAALGLTLGADVPVCLAAPAPAWMAGIGERVRPAAGVPRFWMVLANPGVAVPTPAVFKALASRENPPPAPLDAAVDFAGFVAWLQSTRNDLEPPALSLFPAVGETLDGLRAAEGCALARMSGSGATCFGLFAEAEAALAAAERLRAARPLWWVAAAPVG